MARATLAVVALALAPAAAQAQRQVEGAGDAWGLVWIFAIGAIATLGSVLYFLFALGGGPRRPHA